MKRRSTAAACLMAAAVILVGIAAFNAGWLTEKTYVRAEWNADTLLIVRTGSEAGVLIDDRVAIDALQNSLTWTNFHLECCCGAPDFWAYVYRDGEPIDVLRGFDKPGGDAYNRDFYQRLRAMGQMKPNVCVTRVEVASDVYPEAIRALPIRGALFPQKSEAVFPRGRTMTAAYQTLVDTRDDVPEAAGDTLPLGVFAPDDVFLPLRDALEREGVLRGAGDVRCRMRRYSPKAGESGYERSITFFLNGSASFDAWEGLEVSCSDGREWPAMIASPSPLTDAEWAALKGLGIRETQIVAAR